MTWNPSAPDTLGLEWAPNGETVVALTTALATQAFRVPSFATETIDQLIVPHTWTGPAAGYGRQWVDIYDAGNVVGGNPQVLTYYPNEDKASGGGLRWDDQVSTGNYWARLDDVANDSTAEAEYMMNIGTSSTPATWRGQFNTAAIPTTKRIVSVTLQIRAKGFDWAWQQPRVEVEWWNGATKLGVIGTIYPPQTYSWANYTIGPFYFDLFNEGPWLQPEVAALDNNTLRSLGLSLHYSCAVSRVALEVAVVDETRVAVGIGPAQSTPPAGLQTNLPIALKTPLGVDNWAKAAAHDYYAVVRRLDHPFASSPPLSPLPVALTGAAAPRAHGADLTATIANQGGNPTQIVDGSPTTVHAYVLGTTGGAQSADSQPYSTLAATQCTTLNGVKQDFIDASGGGSTPTKYIMLAGWSSPTPQQMVDNKALLESMPYQGVTIELAGMSETVMVATPISLSAMRAFFAPLNGVVWTHCVHNWVQVVCRQPNGANTFTGDTQWATVAQNFANLAQVIAEQPFLEGIAFDTEQYYGNMWMGTDATGSYNRGKQIMQAMVAVNPNIKVELYCGPMWAQITSRPAGHEGVFTAGMVAGAIGTNAKVSEGGEFYGLETPAEYASFAAAMKDSTRSYIPVPDRSYWSGIMRASFGIYTSQTGYADTPAELEQRLTDALAEADEHVWIYDEQKSWTGTGPRSVAQPYTRPLIDSTMVDAVADAAATAPVSSTRRRRSTRS